MTERPDIDDEAIVAAVKAVRPDAIAIYRFGSTVTGYARPDSDVDVAVLADAPVTMQDRIELTSSVARAVGREADIMDLARASAVARSEVVFGGYRLSGGDERRAARFEVATMRDAQDMAFRNRALNAQLLENGWPHA